MDKIKVEIEVPKPPDGFEVIGPSNTENGDYFLINGSWRLCYGGGWATLTARRKQTLAEWMNEQPDFQALARLIYGFRADHYGAWDVYEGDWPKPPCDGSVISKSGKWFDYK